MKESAFKAPTALLPIAMSLTGLSMVVAYVALFGVVQHQDEGGPARIFQLLLAAQVPLVGLFATKWLPRAPRQALLVLAFQAAAAVAAVGAVLFFESR